MCKLVNYKQTANYLLSTLSEMSFCSKKIDDNSISFCTDNKTLATLSELLINENESVEDSCLICVDGRSYILRNYKFYFLSYKSDTKYCICVSGELNLKEGCV